MASTAVRKLGRRSANPERGLAAKDRPLPLALCLLLWAVMAGAAWGLVMLVVQLA